MFGFGKDKSKPAKAEPAKPAAAAPAAAKPVSIPRGPMSGLMQDWKLTVDKVL